MQNHLSFTKTGSARRAPDSTTPHHAARPVRWTLKRRNDEASDGPEYSTARVTLLNVPERQRPSLGLWRIVLSNTATPRPHRRLWVSTADEKRVLSAS